MVTTRNRSMAAVSADPHYSAPAPGRRAAPDIAPPFQDDDFDFRYRGAAAPGAAAPARSGRVSMRAQTVYLEDLAARFMDNCRRVSERTGRSRSPKTMKYYQSCLDGLVYFANRAGWPPPAQLNREHMQAFRDYLDNEAHRWEGDRRRTTSQRAAPGTVHHYLKVAKTLFNWAVDEGFLHDSPMERYNLPRPQYKDVEPYTDDEISALLRACENDIQRGNRYLGVRNKAVISIFIDTGLRLNELAEMKLSALDPQLQQVRVLGKGSKFRTVPINGEAKRALKTYLTQYRPPVENTDAVWITDDGYPMTDAGVRMLIERLKRRAGVTSGGAAHRFRHYFATRYLENGGDMNVLRLLLGHSTLYMVLRYTKFIEARRALENHAAFSPLDHITRGEKGSHRNSDWGWRPRS